MEGRHFWGTESQALPPISAVMKGFESFARYCRNRWKGLALGALKVSALHFRPMDYFKNYIFGISMKNVKKWCITRLRYTNFNLKCFWDGVEGYPGIRNYQKKYDFFSFELRLKDFEKAPKKPAFFKVILWSFKFIQLELKG